MKAEGHEQETSNREMRRRKGEDTTTLSKFQRLLAEGASRLVPAATLGWGTSAPPAAPTSPTLGFISAGSRRLPIVSHLECRVLYRLKVRMFGNVLRVRFAAPRFDIVHESHTSDLLEARPVRRQRTKLGRVHQASLFSAS